MEGNIFFMQNKGYKNILVFLLNNNKFIYKL